MTSTDIETRIETLERSARRLRLACGALLVLAAVALVAAFRPPAHEGTREDPDVLEAREIRLRDEAGNVRVSMNALEPELRIIGPESSIRFTARDRTNLLEMHGCGGALEFGFAGPEEVAAPHFYLYSADGESTLDLEPSFANFLGVGGRVSLNANEQGDTGFSVRSLEGNKVLFRAP